jgi:NAD(P)-dependent dehydrogenase (short-subunit alcohol dehydrogenase family)
MQKIAVVTGANRGLGFEICRQLARREMKVVLTARDEKKGKEAAQLLQNEGLDISFHQLDVTSEESVRILAAWLEHTFGRVDVLVNNAGILVDNGFRGLRPDIDKIRETMETNAYGPLRVSTAIVPMMLKNKYGRIINVSSGSSIFTSNSTMTGNPGYRLSKLALNGITKLLANELLGRNITVNSMSPRSTRTGMNPDGKRTVEQGADTAVWLATECTATGKFFMDRKETDW